MSTLSDKIAAAWFEGAAVVDDSKGSNTLTNNNGVAYSAGVATFDAPNLKSLDATAAVGLKLGGLDWFCQWRGTLTEKVTAFGQTIYAQDDTGSDRVQYFKYDDATDRYVWDTWTATGAAGENRLVIDESPTEAVEVTMQWWYDKTAGTGGLGRKFGRIGLGTVYEIDAAAAGWSSTIPFRIGSLENLASWYFNGLMNQLLVGNTIPTEAERDWMIDKTWAQIVTGPVTFSPACSTQANVMMGA